MFRIDNILYLCRWNSIDVHIIICSIVIKSSVLFNQTMRHFLFRKEIYYTMYYITYNRNLEHMAILLKWPYIYILTNWRNNKFHYSKAQEEFEACARKEADLLRFLIQHVMGFAMEQYLKMPSSAPNTWETEKKKAHFRADCDLPYNIVSIIIICILSLAH